MISFVMFLFGLAVGSFLNAFIYRMERGESTLHGRSYCPDCKHTLAWYDLIPLLSFALLQGKCRYCTKPISFQYPFVELAIALLFVSLFSMVVENLVKLSFPQILELFYLWTIASLLMVIFVYDLKRLIIPDKVLYPAILVVGIWYLLSSVLFDAYTNYQLLIAILAAIVAAGFFLAIHLLSKGRAMGFGDVKLALFMGLFLSWPNILVAMSLAFAAGAIVGLALIFLKRKTMRSEVPFGPFLILGTLTALFWGDTLVDWYLSFLGV